MGKERQKKKEGFFQTRNGKITLSGLCAVALILLVILMSIESKNNEVIIKNKTDLELEYVQYKFIHSEGALTSPIKYRNIQPNKTKVARKNDIQLTNTYSNMEVRFKFKGYDEIFTDAGIFNGILRGNIEFSFDKINSDEVKVKIKAVNGLFSSKDIDCNEKYIAHLKEGYMEE